MVRTNELPALTIDSCASLCLQVDREMSLTARTTSPGLNPACSPSDFKLTWKSKVETTSQLCVLHNKRLNAWRGILTSLYLTTRDILLRNIIIIIQRNFKCCRVGCDCECSILCHFSTKKLPILNSIRNVESTDGIIGRICAAKRETYWKHVAPHTCIMHTI